MKKREREREETSCFRGNFYWKKETLKINHGRRRDVTCSTKSEDETERVENRVKKEW